MQLFPEVSFWTYRALVSSVLLYGSETWNLTNRDCNRLNAFDMSCLRRLENVKWYYHVRNSTIRQQIKQHPVSITLTQRRLLVRSPAAYATRKWSVETTKLLPGHNRLNATKRPSTTTMVGLRISRPRNHRSSPRWGSSYRPSSHRLACCSSSCDLYAGWPARALIKSFWDICLWH